ncbi:S1 family peptidase [Amycolatopsis decaplanina]|uniref:Serine protease n=1 Tax=Amycolatopsis decaplanina DSM 44594 TaxID=1284240 RepID=M2ZGV9_9PSEU|nr:S1 family peptidase [Amycolatopsis decaplanina]EME60123.1 serine protease precursor [Amycolatopsis decaplanina DSM 44594]
MKITKLLGVAATAALATGALVTGTPAAASSASSVTLLNAEMVPALQRDLGLTSDQALARIQSETAAGTLEQSLASALAGSFGGASYNEATGKLRVGVTDAAKLGQVLASGAEAELVRFSAAQLDSTVDKLNAGERAADGAITGWGVDTKTNRVTVNVLPGKSGVVDSYLEKTGVDKAAVAVVETTGVPTLKYDVRGGDAYYINSSSRCSIGFSVNGGFLTAGHCGPGTVTGSNQVAMGSFARVSFPTNDYGHVRVNSNWVPRGIINNGTRVSGSTVAATGASVCKSGSTTGWTCGTVGAKNQTVRYAEGTVYGMTATNVRSQAGDSGGSFIAGNQAQGMLSGGNSSVTYFFPVRPALSATGTSLVLG